MKKILVLLLAFPFQGHASPPTVLEQLNRVEWKTDHMSVDEAVQADEKAAMQDIVTGLDCLPREIRESVIDPMLPPGYEQASYSGSFLGSTFENERAHPVRAVIDAVHRADRLMHISRVALRSVRLVGVFGISQVLATERSDLLKVYLKLLPCCYVPAGVAIGCLLYPAALSTIRNKNPLNRHLTAVQDIRVSEDGNYFVTLSQDKSLLWNLKTNKCLGKCGLDRPELEQRFDPVTSPKGYRNLSVANGQVQFNGNPARDLRAPYPITAATYTRDGKKIIAGTSIGSIHTYRQKEILKEAFNGLPTKKQERRKKQLKWGVAAAVAVGAAYIGSYLWKNSK